MVMDSSHSAKNVGREFVRQYYTLLHEAPAHLHRFYSHNSIFLHGGMSNKDSDIEPAIGQRAIHQRIQHLNFRDCHTIISQVDSQATLGNGVVVQVTGELSNGGDPMRRFTQTFVLAAATRPKTYYVHNDIFRYQDLGFLEDEENEIGEECGPCEITKISCKADEETDEDQEQQQCKAPEQREYSAPITTPPDNIQQHQQPVYYPVMSQMHSIGPVINGNVHEDTCAVSQPQLLPQPSVQSMPCECPETVPEEQFSQEHVIVPEDQSQAQQQPQQPQQSDAPIEETLEMPDKSSEQQVSETNEAEIEHNVTANANTNRPKSSMSYARKLCSNSMGSGNNHAFKSSVSPPPMTNVRNDDRPMDMWISKNTNIVSSVMSGSQHRMSSNQMSEQHQVPQHQRPPRSGGAPPQKDNRNRRDWPDNHQLFVGNVPHQATEIELKVIFERFGKVVDLKIFAKNNERAKGPQGQNNSTRVPHYGFVTFEDSSVVSKVLSACPIGYPDESGQKLNIEEKKNKQRVLGDGNVRSNPSEPNMRSSMGGQQQHNQQPRGPGIMRGGQHSRGGRGFSRGDGGRGGMRQPGNMGNPGYQNRR